MEENERAGSGRVLGRKRERSWEVRPSGIHARGLFASRPIRAGERIIEYVGERITKAESNRRGLARMEKARRRGGGMVYIFELNKRYDLDGNKPWNPARLANHSCDPNCEVENQRGHLWMVARREIEAGEELTYDYGYDLQHFLEHPCRCGSPRCVGYIVRTDARMKLKRLLGRARKSGTRQAGAEEA